MFGGDTSYWDTLVATYESTDVAAEKMRILQILGCSEKEDLLRKSVIFSYLFNVTKAIFRSLDFSLDESDGHVVFESVYQSGNVGAKLALEFLVSNYNNMSQRLYSWKIF